MAEKKSHKSIAAVNIMVLFSGISFIISLFNYFLPSSPIAHTGGAELVICTTLAISILSVLIYFFRHIHSKLERVSLYVLILLMLLGTLFAAWLLESYSLFIAMLIVLVAWFAQVIVS